MAIVKIERACGCVKNSDLEMETQCANVDEALEKANEMVMTMNEDFCHKHRFKTSYEDGVVLIKMEMNG
ncbi:MAG: hypothetical protein ACPG9K_01560 [Poseidonibacter sp.]